MTLRIADPPEEYMTVQAETPDGLVYLPLEACANSWDWDLLYRIAGVTLDVFWCRHCDHHFTWGDAEWSETMSLGLPMPLCPECGRHARVVMGTSAVISEVGPSDVETPRPDRAWVIRELDKHYRREAQEVA